MSKVRFGQRGYAGFSYSSRAVEAMREGRAPLTRAVAELAGEAKIRTGTARRLLVALGSSEWHHVSKHANAVDFYDWAHVAAVLAGQEDAESDALEAAVAELDLVAERAAAEKAAARAAKAAATKAAEAAADAALVAALNANLDAVRREVYARLQAAKDAHRAEQVRILRERYVADPTPGRAQALRNYGVDPNTLVQFGA